MGGEAIQPVPGAATDLTCHPALSAGADFLNSFSADGPLLVALSGGSDSTALLHVFDRLIRSRTPSFPRLTAATVDHGLREGSRAEAQAAAVLCERLGIPHRILEWTGEKPRTGLQAAAREARYGLLAAEAQRIGAQAILLGHTADDQAETIAMRAARGEGRGLSGMAPAVLLQESVWAFRPLLSQSRQALRALLLEAGIGWLDDPSNLNIRFERARLRRDGAPHSLPDIGSAAFRSVEAQAEAEWIARHVTVLAADVGRLDLAGLAGLADGPEAWGLFRLASAIGGRIHAPGREARTRLVAWLAAGEPGRRTLAGTVFDRRREALFLYREARGIADSAVVAGDVADGRYRLAGPAGMQGRVRPVSRPEGAVRHLLEAGVPEAIARRAAPACLEIVEEGGGSGLRLDRIIAGGSRFLPCFDLVAMQALRRCFGLAPLPALPVRQ